ncbi:putative agmatine deiminase [Clostridium polyendosporum]|uniref:Putative agmatine deiminase n=1 Tax=Clostridium polyendosporum TaxID=69208 RepID=A0A919RW78_9CLOT|nr:agmatine deiminase [Clostridium polyendosporum]GIM27612.1 putative agmatine deiminase [Clostridium polyendosporum]
MLLPVKLGFRMPAEWEKRLRTFMEWPIREEIWSHGLENAKKGYSQVAKVIAEFEEVIMIARADMVEEAKRMCGEKVKVVPMEHDDSWIRDNGPTFIINSKGELAGVNWKFNAWGEKYTPYDKDDKVAEKVLELYEIPRFDAPIVLEGGSIHVDGEGTLITTEECLLNRKRNPHLTRGHIEEVLTEYLAVEKVIWLKKGLYGDETDGHVDNVACFAKPGTIVIQVCRNREDPNYMITIENLKLLENARDAKDRMFEIIQIEQPPARYLNGERLTLSYINYYPVEGGIILPVFGGDAEHTDKEAIKILQDIYPYRKIVPVDGMPIIKGGGNVHCITQQMPYGSPAKL